MNSAQIVEALRKDVLVKCIKTDFFLPSLKSSKFTICDFSSRVRFDEQYYKKTKSLLLRRGVAAVYSESNNLEFLSVGAPKFGYLDDQFTDTPNFEKLRLIERVYTEKENGEAGHLAFFPTDSFGWYAVIGSKNVHITLNVDNLQKAKTDLAYYKSLKSLRLNTAIANAELVLSFAWNSMNNLEIRKFLHSNIQTIVFEGIQNNHIVHYDTPQALIAFAVTQPQFESVDEQGLCMDPTKSLPLLKSWGFRIPEFTIGKTESEWKALDSEYENKYNSEGAVVYEIYESLEDPGSQRRITARIYKHKNHVYIVQRAARELIKKCASYGNWMNRFENMHINIDHLKDQIKLLLAMYLHLVKTKQTEHPKWSDICQVQFKTYLRDFMQYSTRKEQDALLSQASFILSQASRGSSDLSQIVPGSQALMLVGVQGSGKTTMRNALIQILANSHPIRYVNQDELGGSRKAFIRGLQPSKKNPKELVIVDKCNHLYTLREDVYSLYETVYIVEFVAEEEEEGGQDNSKSLLVNICESRLKQRGFAHPTLQYSTNAVNIIQSFASDFEPVSDYEKQKYRYMAVNIASEFTEKLKSVMTFINLAKQSEQSSSDLSYQLIQKQRDYESTMQSMVLDKCTYWRASAFIPDIHAQVLSLIDEDKFPGIKFKWMQDLVEDDRESSNEEYHVTLVYGRKPTKEEAAAWFKDLFITGKVTSICYDDKAVALKVDFGLKIERIPHITLGTANGVPNAYAGEMIASPGHKEIPCEPFTLSMVINPVIFTNKNSSPSVGQKTKK
jgi:energy-coupling factor transporter ATP-binding protein EcfA2